MVIIEIQWVEQFAGLHFGEHEIKNNKQMLKDLYNFDIELIPQPCLLKSAKKEQYQHVHFTHCLCITWSKYLQLFLTLV